MNSIEVIARSRHLRQQAAEGQVVHRAQLDQLKKELIVSAYLHIQTQLLHLDEFEAASLLGNVISEIKTPSPQPPFLTLLRD